MERERVSLCYTRLLILPTDTHNSIIKKILKKRNTSLGVAFRAERSSEVAVTVETFLFVGRLVMILLSSANKIKEERNDGFSSAKQKLLKQEQVFLTPKEKWHRSFAPLAR